MLKRVLSLALVAAASWVPVAQAAASSAPAHMEGGFNIASFMPMILLVAIVYFLLLRPQMKKNREHRSLIANLQKGDEVLTTSGIMGKINRIGENFVELAVSDTVNIKLQKDAISAMMPKGAGKAD